MLAHVRELPDQAARAGPKSAPPTATDAVGVDALQRADHPLAALGAAAQALLTEVRRTR